MALTLGTTGMDSATEAELRAAFQQANATAGGRWQLVSEAEADYVVVDMDSMYGPMSWLRLHAAGKHVVGLTARRGRAIPVFSLGALLGLPVVELPEATRVVVLDAPGEPALAVDAVFEDDLPDDEALRPAPDTMASDARALVRGTTGDGRLLLDVEALLASPRLTIDVGPRAARRG